MSLIEGPHTRGNIAKELSEVLTKKTGVLEANLDNLFLIMAGLFVFFMQCGFAFLEAGAVRSRNTTNILMKNMLDVFISGVIYWLVGYALAFGEGNGFCGTEFWAMVGVEDEKLAFWFFQFVFAASAATIVSGSMAERCAFGAYFVYSTAITGFIYPIVSHWAWSGDGWLVDSAYQDFAGSGVVHLTGGVASLAGAVILGPRIGRFGPNGKEIRGHSLPLAALGGFILLFGFLAFNGGSQASISKEGDTAAVAKAIVNTVIAGCGGGITSLFLYRTGIFEPMSKWSFLMTLNGALAGMVSICAGCNVMKPWGAFVTGAIAAFLFLVIHTVLPKLQVDDPLDAVGVHMGGGFWGLVAVALFQDDGIVHGGSLEVLAWNMAGALAIMSWTGGLCVIIFGLLRLMGVLRVPAEMEEQGLDILKHGEPAYPVEAWQEPQYSNPAKAEENQKDLNLPPNMTWDNNWSGYQGPYQGPALCWTLPNARRPRYYPPHFHQSFALKISQFYPNENNPGYDPPPAGIRADDGEEERERDNRGYGTPKSLGYIDDGYYGEHAKL
ncbi:putative ammonium transporter 1 [Macrobrachium rosenbergii]|uniref:putative ammonium transporter 1 n=1 Tax=Macrobrachium rosenbergii TaxID=79674 RepID=UPI0034D6C401